MVSPVWPGRLTLSAAGRTLTPVRRPRLPTWLLVSLVAACRAEGDDTAAMPADTAPPPSAETTAVWAPEDVPTAMSAALPDGIPSPKLLRDVYFTLIHEGQDETCPGSDQLDGANRKGCTSTAGYFYSGVSTWMEEDYGNGTGWMLSVDLEITDPTGNSFLAGGHASHRLQSDTNFTQIQSELSGSWLYEGYPGWLGEGVSALLMVNGTVDGTGARVNVSGGLTTLDQPLYFEGLSWAPDTCGPAATGTVWVRDPSGAWWSVILTASCDGCGPATFDGRDAGTVCLPVAPMMDALVEDLSTP